MSSTSSVLPASTLVWDLCQNIVEGGGSDSTSAPSIFNVDMMRQIDSYSSSYLFGTHQGYMRSSDKNAEESNAVDTDESNILSESLNEEMGGAGMDGLHLSLVLAESTCKSFISDLDHNLENTNNIISSYHQISSRTNDLVLNCENLLEQQAHLQATADNLKQFLAPFDDLDDISLKLGIPLESSTATAAASKGGIANSNSSNKSNFGTINVSESGSAISNTNYAISDNKWKDFKGILSKLTKAARFIKQHPGYHDSEKFSKIVERLQIRATSLVAQSMKEHIEGAASVCRELLNKNAIKKIKWNLEEMPLESSPIYQRFRSLSFRLRELTALLHWNVSTENSISIDPSDAADDNNNKGRTIRKDGTLSKIVSNNSPAEVAKAPDSHIIEDVFKSYISTRTELLIPIIRDTADILTANVNKLKAARSPKASDDSARTGEVSGLCSCIRQSFMLLLRLAQLEQQLFDSLFNDSSNSGESPTGASTVPNPSSTPGALVVVIPTKASNPNPNSEEVLNIIQLICQGTHDSLRPLLIHESSIDELCKIVSVLVEDIRMQIVAMNQLSKPVIQLLLSILDSTTQDAQERLVYLAEVKMRLEVQLFEPTEKDLVISQTRNVDASATEVGSGVSSDDINLDDISKSWYPPLKTTLSLLSKLYGIIEMTVFEDLANRVVQYCVSSINQAADKVRKSQSVLHNDLFLLRHLLILREQLSPFEIRLLSIVKKLDFRPTTHVFSHLIASTGSAKVHSDYKNNNGNSSDVLSNMMMSMIIEGLPSMEELKTDTKAELDKLLKITCTSLKQDAIKAILNPLEAFLAKVLAFAIEIPVLLDDGRIMRSNSTIISQHELKGSESEALLSQEATIKLKKENFMKIDRIQEMLTSLQQTSTKATSDFRDLLKLYIENSIARTVLLKPIQQEVDLTKRRMVCVLHSCIDAGSARTALEQSLDTTIFNILAELHR